jgi:hypothetical protein
MYPSRSGLKSAAEPVLPDRAIPASEFQFDVSLDDRAMLGDQIGGVKWLEIASGASRSWTRRMQVCNGVSIVAKITFASPRRRSASSLLLLKTPLHRKPSNSTELDFEWKTTASAISLNL